MLTNYVQLLLYILYEQSDLYMLVTTKSLSVVATSSYIKLMQT